MSDVFQYLIVFEVLHLVLNQLCEYVEMYDHFVAPIDLLQDTKFQMSTTAAEVSIIEQNIGHQSICVNNSRACAGNCEE